MPIDLRRRFGDLSRCGDEKVPSTPRIIKIFHPGYGTSDAQPHIRDALFSMPAFDDGGIHYDTVHTACGILAGNRWDGYFSHDRDGSTRVQPPNDGVLRESSYFFCLPPSSDLSTSALVSAPASASTKDSTDPYPVVARFGDWRFPHGNLPPLWEKLRPQFDAGQNRILRRCILTDAGFSLHGAHLVPSAQSEWFNSNSMADYGQAASFSREAIHAPTNSVYLRQDVHHIFDERSFCFVPKFYHAEEKELALRIPRGVDPVGRMNNSRDGNLETGQDHHEDHDEASQTERRTTPQIQQELLVVGHVFTTIPGGEIQQHWHNREVYNGVYAASLECLFARFAWTVFSPTLLRDFLHMTTKPRTLLVWNDDLGKIDIQQTAPEKCKSILKGARSRSESPTKRPRPTGDADQDEGISDEGLYESQDSLYEDASSDIDSGYHGGLHLSELDDFGLVVSSVEEQEPERGRTRKRKHEESYGGAFETGDEYIGTKRVSLDII